MAIELRVEGRIQRSPMSCWWASMSMILGYYGHDYSLPHDFKSEFRRPANRPTTVIPDLRYPTVGNNTDRDLRLIETPDLIFEQPYEWYVHGLPINSHAFQLLSDISGFRGVNRPAFGSWTANDVESKLRQYGPYAFFGEWNGDPHSIVVVGLIQSGSETNVVTIDPIRGFPTSETLSSFNSRMSRIMPDFSGLNPIYFPTSNPVRAVINH